MAKDYTDSKCTTKAIVRIENVVCLLIMTKRKRRQVALRIDEGILEMLSKLAKADNTSMNKYLEKHFLEYGKRHDLLPLDFELLGETRGGDRSNKLDSEESQ